MWRVEEAKDELETYYAETTVPMDWVQEEIYREADREVKRIVESYFNEPITKLVACSKQLQEIRGEHVDVIDEVCSLISKLETEAKWGDFA